ncbi:MAG TPA: WbqC family protein [Ignavibacteria bacterium]|nr:WbqC family protein [Ignavibacteria bacterium]
MNGKKIAIMQPYFMPYIGYFQLINAVDEFVFLDDVNFINRGWINRNRILLNGRDFLFTIPCKKVSQNKLINEVEVGEVDLFYEKFKQTLQMAYNKSPYFEQVNELLDNIFSCNSEFISDFAINSIECTLEYLKIKKTLKISSKDFKNNGFKGFEKLTDICKQADIFNYINPSGGTELYNKVQFAEKGISLFFLMPEEVKYSQFKKEFIPWLSIIDVLMFNSPEKIKSDFLNNYRIE